MSGYGTNSSEVQSTNQLLRFAGMSYNQDDIDGTCPSQYNGLCYCWSNTIPISDWRSSDPNCAAISYQIREVGVYHGRSISAGSGSVCAVDDQGNDIAVTQSVGNGHVFVFADEWVTFTSQWHPAPDAGIGNNIGQANSYNPCWLADAGASRTADVEFQIPQFWYNVLSWASTAQCPFVINEPDIIPVIK